MGENDRTELQQLQTSIQNPKKKHKNGLKSSQSIESEEFKILAFKVKNK